jgi:hypothetical protein
LLTPAPRRSAPIAPVRSPALSRFVDSSAFSRASFGTADGPVVIAPHAFPVLLTDFLLHLARSCFFAASMSASAGATIFASLALSVLACRANARRDVASIAATSSEA